MSTFKEEMLARCSNNYKKVPRGGLELRMYYFTIYQLSGIQAGIQAGHAALRYGRKYGNDLQFLDFIDNWETTIVLNGGTTNWTIVENVFAGSINELAAELFNANIKNMLFIEPDLNDALTAICFLVDERVFNKKKYPDFDDWFDPEADRSEILLNWMERLSVTHTTQTIINLFNEWYSETAQYEKRYCEWRYLVGGEKNVKLRELLKDKKLAY